MKSDNTFTDFIGRIRAGDQQAAEELVRRFEPVIRREVRLRLHDSRFRRLFDSMDICQSVLASFFVRAASGQYELSRPENLVKLLVGMTKRKLDFQVRKQRAVRRDYRRLQEVGTDDLEEAVAAEPNPSELVATRELLDEFRRRLTTEERQLAALRSQGYQWAAIASQLGGSAEACRKQFIRCLNRVARELGLGEEADDE